MLLSRNFLLVCTVFFLQIAIASQQNIIEYQKSLSSNHRIDASAIFYEDYSETRWDSNGDGSIDQWLVTKGSITIKEFFKQKRLSRIIFYLTGPKEIVKLTYGVDLKSEIKIVSVTILPNKKYFQDSKDSFEQMYNEVNVMAFNSGCQQTLYTKFAVNKDVKSFLNVVDENYRKEQLRQLIDPSCSNMQPAVQEHQFENAVFNVYGSNFKGYVEQNKILSCLAKNENTSDLFPMYLKETTVNLNAQSKLNVKCRKIESKDCGQASMDMTLGGLTEIPYSDPPCNSKMETVFSGGIMHEKLHRSDLELPEEDVNNIVKGCVWGDPSALAKVRPNTTVGEKGASGTLAPAEVQERNLKLSQEIQTMVPPEIAEGAISPPSSTSEGSLNLLALNSGFRNIAGVYSASGASSSSSRSEDLNQSYHRTSNLIKTAEFLQQSITPALADEGARLAGANEKYPSSNQTTGKPDDIANRTGIARQANSKNEAVQPNRGLASIANGNSLSRASTLTDSVLSSGIQNSVPKKANPKNKSQNDPLLKKMEKEIGAAKSPDEVVKILERNESSFRTAKMRIYYKAAGKVFIFPQKDPNSPKKSDVDIRNFSLIGAQFIQE
jgi:hypothetical protein